MPSYVVQRAQALLANDGIPVTGADILILGVTYKPDIADTRESPAFEVTRVFREHCAIIKYHDPDVASLSVDGIEIAVGECPSPRCRRCNLHGPFAKPSRISRTRGKPKLSETAWHAGVACSKTELAEPGLGGIVNFAWKESPS